ncbi:RNA-binding protein [Candidatus Pacearchaeota archaeon]|nr:RNA-binding protein [Candidatus Pacearchaeota archaeon]
MKLYVGNLPWSIDENGLKELFANFTVEEAVLIKDRYSGRSKGFGFVTIADDEAAGKAISEMNEKELEGRKLTVSEAKPMVPRDNASRD